MLGCCLRRCRLTRAAPRAQRELALSNVDPDSSHFGRVLYHFFDANTMQVALTSYTRVNFARILLSAAYEDAPPAFMDSSGKLCKEPGVRMQLRCCGGFVRMFR